MSDDRLLSSLAALAREEEQTLAAAPDADARLSELTQPLDASELGALQALVQRQLRPQPTPAAAVVRRRPSRRNVLLAAGATLTAAAAAFALLRVPSAQLPDYQLAIAGGLAVERGAPAPDRTVSPLRLASDGQLEIVLSPARAVSAPLQVHTFVRTQAEWALVHAQAELSKTGSVRIAGSVEQLFGDTRGPARLALVLSTRTLDAADARALLDARESHAADWRRIELAVVIVAPRP